MSLPFAWEVLSQPTIGYLQRAPPKVLLDSATGPCFRQFGKQWQREPHQLVALVSHHATLLRRRRRRRRAGTRAALLLPAPTVAQRVAIPPRIDLLTGPARGRRYRRGRLVERAPRDTAALPTALPLPLQLPRLPAQVTPLSDAERNRRQHRRAGSRSQVRRRRLVICARSRRQSRPVVLGMRLLLD